MSNPTPVGEFAVSAKQTPPPSMPDEGAAHTEAGVPVEGTTPVGETVQSAPPAPVQVTPEDARTSRVQSARNLALLARTAIGNGYPSMTVAPKMVADLCTAVEESLTSNTPTIESSLPVPDATAAVAKIDAAIINDFKSSCASMAEMAGGPVAIWHNDRTGSTTLFGGGLKDPSTEDGWRRLYAAHPASETVTPTEDKAAESFAGPGQGNS